MRTIEELKNKALQTGRTSWHYSGCPCGCTGTYSWDSKVIRYTGNIAGVSQELTVETVWVYLQNNYNNDDADIYERHEREWGFIND